MCVWSAETLPAYRELHIKISVWSLHNHWRLWSFGLHLLFRCCDVSKDTSTPVQGYCVLIGSVFRSIPQIIRIVRNKRSALSCYNSCFIAALLNLQYIARAHRRLSADNLLVSVLGSVIWICAVNPAGIWRKLTSLLLCCSVEGLSLTSFISELIAYTITSAYNFNLGECQPGSASSCLPATASKAIWFLSLFKTGFMCSR